MESKVLIPKLRFNNENGNPYPDWNEKKLGEVVPVITDFVASGSFESLRNNVSVYDSRNYALYVRLTDLRKGLKHDDLRYVDESSYNFLSKSNLNGGEILIANIGANVGDTFLMPNIEGKATIAPNMIVLMTDHQLFNSRFLFAYLNTFFGRKNVNRAISGSGQPKINKTDLKQVKVIMPTLTEQQKIASFLTSVDSRISLLEKKKQALEQYKKGVMQKLFSQQLRFKDENGNPYPDWEEKKLGEIANVKRGAGSQYIKYSDDLDHSIRLIRIGDFLGNDPVYVTATKEIQRFKLEKDDILIAGTGATAGITFLVPDTFIGLAYSYNAPRIKVIMQSTLYIIYFLKSHYIIKQQRRLFTGNAQPFLDTNAIKNFKLGIPTLVEQIKIANFLSSIDKKIDHTNNLIEKTREFKKGLLQQMFV